MLGRSLAPSGCPVTPSVGPRRRGDATFQRDSFYFDSESAPESACSRPPLPAYVFRVRQKNWKGSDLTQRRDERQRGRRRAAVTTCQNADRLPGSLSVCQSDRQPASQPASQEAKPGQVITCRGGRTDGPTEKRRRLIYSAASRGTGVGLTRRRRRWRRGHGQTANWRNEVLKGTADAAVQAREGGRRWTHMADADAAKRASEEGKIGREREMVRRGRKEERQEVVRE